MRAFVCDLDCHVLKLDRKNDFFVFGDNLMFDSIGRTSTVSVSGIQLGLSLLHRMSSSCVAFAMVARHMSSMVEALWSSYNRLFTGDGYLVCLVALHCHDDVVLNKVHM